MTSKHRYLEALANTIAYESSISYKRLFALKIGRYPGLKVITVPSKGAVSCWVTQSLGRITNKM
jgi:hypothetical protein